MTLPETAASVAALLLLWLAFAVAKRIRARRAEDELRRAFCRQYVVPLQRFARERDR